MMTKREVFDKVKNHLLAQGVASKDPESATCYYRGPNGTKCAVGCLIADEHFQADFNTSPFYHNRVREALEASGVDTSDIDTFELLDRAQRIHDRYHPSEWPARLDNLESAFFGVE